MEHRSAGPSFGRREITEAVAPVAVAALGHFIKIEAKKRLTRAAQEWVFLIQAVLGAAMFGVSESLDSSLLLRTGLIVFGMGIVHYWQVHRLPDE